MTGETVVEARDLVVRYGSFTAVDHISFAVKRGEIFGFLGANGAGKTTTIRVLCGLLQPTAGDVRVAGAGYADGETAIKIRVGYMSQKFTLYNDLTVGENLDFIASLRKLDRSYYLERRSDLLNLISFTKGLDATVRDLSGGIKQQVSLAAALLHDPEIVFLDEPTAGVTPAGRDRFWKLIHGIAERGKTVFVTTHYMDEAEQCGRIALMRDGKLVATDTPAGLKSTAFPEPLYELDPVARLNPADVAAWEEHEGFAFFERYGPRFHASPLNAEEWQRRRPELERQFRIRPVAPSLEDVFLRIIEGPR
ncbi:MAG TPA: ABC transporter ATP-binding protein [Elusimicrobiota bacterium]|nr:ABC transporter ATP-binding protein [Elusimicrobiota bacterium]